MGVPSIMNNDQATRVIDAIESMILSIIYAEKDGRYHYGVFRDKQLLIDLLTDEDDAQ